MMNYYNNLINIVILKSAKMICIKLIIFKFKLILLIVITYSITWIRKNILLTFFVSIYRNPRVPCRSGIIPSVDLNKWADFPTS